MTACLRGEETEKRMLTINSEHILVDIKDLLLLVKELVGYCKLARQNSMRRIRSGG